MIYSLFVFLVSIYDGMGDGGLDVQSLRPPVDSELLLSQHHDSLLQIEHTCVLPT